MSSLRYWHWHARDFLADRAPLPVLLIGFLIAGIAIDPRFRKSPTTFMTDGNGAVLVRGALLLFVIAVVLFATIGMVSEDRTRGTFRLLFAKPVGMLAYYGGKFLVCGISACALIAVVILGASMLFRTDYLLPLLLAAPLAYVALGGVGFLLSTLTRHDGLVLVASVVAGYLAFGHVNAIAYVLPPVWVLKGFVADGSQTFPMPSAVTIAWALSYGIAAIALGLLSLFQFRFRS